METGWGNVDPRIRLLMHGWGMLPGADGAYAKDAITSQKVAAAAAHFSLALRSGPFIWPSGQTGKHPATEKYIQHWSELPEDVPGLKSGNRHVDYREGPMSAQAWLTYDNLFKIIGERGCTKNDVLHETIYIKNIDQLPALDRVRRQIWPDPGNAPAATVVQTVDIGMVPIAQLEIDFVALHPGNAQGWTRKAIVEVDGLRSAVHGPVVTQAGAFRFVAAQHGLLKNGRPAANLSELDGSLRAIRAGHIYAERAAEAQSWLIYDRLRRILEGTGASLENLVKVNAYFDDAADIVSFQRVGALALDGTVHATAAVPVKRAGRTLDHAVVADAIAIVESSK
jgi:enamine deaminase RidA (YjgF/YER057c/UK114 family)